MKQFPDARAFLVEGYPRDALQYENFNRNVRKQLFNYSVYFKKKLITRITIAYFLKQSFL